MLKDDNWVACRNLEALCFTSFAKEKHDSLNVLFRNNSSFWLSDYDFYDLNPGQLEFLLIDYCANLELTATLADKLAELLVGLKYSCFRDTNLQYLCKMKNLRSLDLKVEMEWLEIDFIADIAKNCRIHECLFLAISFNSIRKKMPREDHDMLLQIAAHLEFFVIDTCDKCVPGTSSSDSCCCCRHCRGSLSWLELSSF